MAKAEVIRTASPICAATGVFPRPRHPAGLYALAGYCAKMAAREGDYAKRRRLEKRARALWIAARQAIRALDGGRAS